MAFLSEKQIKQGVVVVKFSRTSSQQKPREEYIVIHSSRSVDTVQFSVQRPPNNSPVAIKNHATPTTCLSKCDLQTLSEWLRGLNAQLEFHVIRMRETWSVYCALQDMARKLMFMTGNHHQPLALLNANGQVQKTESCVLDEHRPLEVDLNISEVEKRIWLYAVDQTESPQPESVSADLIKKVRLICPELLNPDSDENLQHIVRELTRAQSLASVQRKMHKQNSDKAQAVIKQELIQAKSKGQAISLKKIINQCKTKILTEGKPPQDRGSSLEPQKEEKKEVKKRSMSQDKDSALQLLEKKIQDFQAASEQQSQQQQEILLTQASQNPVREEQATGISINLNKDTQSLFGSQPTASTASQISKTDRQQIQAIDVNQNRDVIELMEKRVQQTDPNKTERVYDSAEELDIVPQNHIDIISANRIPLKKNIEKPDEGKEEDPKQENPMLNNSQEQAPGQALKQEELEDIEQKLIQELLTTNNKIDPVMFQVALQREILKAQKMTVNSENMGKKAFAFDVRLENNKPPDYIFQTSKRRDARRSLLAQEFGTSEEQRLKQVSKFVATLKYFTVNKPPEMLTDFYNTLSAMQTARRAYELKKKYEQQQRVMALPYDGKIDSEWLSSDRTTSKLAQLMGDRRSNSDMLETLSDLVERKLINAKVEIKGRDKDLFTHFMVQLEAGRNLQPQLIEKQEADSEESMLDEGSQDDVQDITYEPEMIEHHLREQMASQQSNQQEEEEIERKRMHKTSQDDEIVPVKSQAVQNGDREVSNKQVKSSEKVKLPNKRFRSDSQSTIDRQSAVKEAQQISSKIQKLIHIECKQSNQSRAILHIARAACISGHSFDASKLEFERLISPENQQLIEKLADSKISCHGNLSSQSAKQDSKEQVEDNQVKNQSDEPAEQNNMQIDNEQQEYNLSAAIVDNQSGDLEDSNNSEQEVFSPKREKKRIVKAQDKESKLQGKYFYKSRKLPKKKPHRKQEDPISNSEDDEEEEENEKDRQQKDDKVQPQQNDQEKEEVNKGQELLDNNKGGNKQSLDINDAPEDGEGDKVMKDLNELESSKVNNQQNKIEEDQKGSHSSESSDQDDNLIEDPANKNDDKNPVTHNKSKKDADEAEEDAKDKGEGGQNLNSAAEAIGNAPKEEENDQQKSDLVDQDMNEDLVNSEAKKEEVREQNKQVKDDGNHEENVIMEKGHQNLNEVQNEVSDAKGQNDQPMELDNEVGEKEEQSEDAQDIEKRDSSSGRTSYESKGVESQNKRQGDNEPSKRRASLQDEDRKEAAPLDDRENAAMNNEDTKEQADQSSRQEMTDPKTMEANMQQKKLAIEEDDTEKLIGNVPDKPAKDDQSSKQSIKRESQPQPKDSKKQKFSNLTGNRYQNSLSDSQQEQLANMKAKIQQLEQHLVTEVSRKHEQKLNQINMELKARSVPQKKCSACKKKICKCDALDFVPTPTCIKSRGQYERKNNSNHYHDIWKDVYNNMNGEWLPSTCENGLRADNFEGYSALEPLTQALKQPGSTPSTICRQLLIQRSFESPSLKYNIQWEKKELFKIMLLNSIGVVNDFLFNTDDETFVDIADYILLGPHNTNDEREGIRSCLLIHQMAAQQIQKSMKLTKKILDGKWKNPNHLLSLAMVRQQGQVIMGLKADIWSPAQPGIIEGQHSKRVTQRQMLTAQLLKGLIPFDQDMYGDRTHQKRSDGLTTTHTWKDGKVKARLKVYSPQNFGVQFNQQGQDIQLAVISSVQALNKQSIREETPITVPLLGIFKKENGYAEVMELATLLCSRLYLGIVSRIIEKQSQFNWYGSREKTESAKYFTSLANSDDIEVTKEEDHARLLNKLEAIEQALPKNFKAYGQVTTDDNMNWQIRAAHGALRLPFFINKWMEFEQYMQDPDNIEHAYRANLYPDNDSTIGDTVWDHFQGKFYAMNTECPYWSFIDAINGVFEARVFSNVDSYIEAVRITRADNREVVLEDMLSRRGPSISQDPLVVTKINDRITQVRFKLVSTIQENLAVQCHKDIRTLLVYLDSHKTKRGIIEVNYKYDSTQPCFAMHYAVIFNQGGGWMIKLCTEPRLRHLESDQTAQEILLNKAVKIHFWEPEEYYSPQKNEILEANRKAGVQIAFHNWLHNGITFGNVDMLEIIRNPKETEIKPDDFDNKSHEQILQLSERWTNKRQHSEQKVKVRISPHGKKKDLEHIKSEKTQAFMLKTIQQLSANIRTNDPAKERELAKQLKKALDEGKELLAKAESQRLAQIEKEEEHREKQQVYYDFAIPEANHEDEDDIF